MLTLVVGHNGCSRSAAQPLLAAAVAAAATAPMAARSQSSTSLSLSPLTVCMSTSSSSNHGNGADVRSEADDGATPVPVAATSVSAVEPFVSAPAAPAAAAAAAADKHTTPISSQGCRLYSQPHHPQQDYRQLQLRSHQPRHHARNSPRRLISSPLGRPAQFLPWVLPLRVRRLRPLNSLSLHSHSQIQLQTRGKKTTTTVRLSDLPQGLLAPASGASSGGGAGAVLAKRRLSRRDVDSDDDHGHAQHDVDSEKEKDKDKEDLEEDAAPAYPTVVQQARQNMRKFDNCVLLTRVGGFYELYFEHADEYGPLLNLKVASKKTNAGRVPMAGFPFFQLDRFLKILVQDLGRHVAIAEEFPNTAADRVKSGGLMHDRRVARIVTPGTLIDENFMDPYASNYVMAIDGGGQAAAIAAGRLSATQGDNSDELGQGRQPSSGHLPRSSPSSQVAPEAVPLGLAWLDLSTGHFGTQQTNLASLPSILSRVCPHELVLSQEFEGIPDHPIFPILADDRHLITFSSQAGLLGPSDWTPMLEGPLPHTAAEAFSSEEVAAVGLVLNYVGDRLQGMSMKLQPPQRHEHMQIMSVDKNSLRALEVKQTIRDGAFRGSLLHALRRTVTKSGTRLLTEWLSAPSTSLDVITTRQDVVARFLADRELRDTIILLLRRSHDSQRLVQRFALGRGDADDLLGLANTIGVTEDIMSLLGNNQLGSPQDGTGKPNDCFASLASRISLAEPLKLARRIKDAIDEDSILQQHQAEDSAASHMMALADDVVSNEGTPDDASILPKTKGKRTLSIREYYAEDSDVWIMKPAASRTLNRLHKELDSLLAEKESLNEELRERLGAASLTLRWTPGLGHIAHIKGKDTKNLTDIKALSASRSTRSFHLPEWTGLGQRLDQVRIQIRSEERAVFQSLREHVVRNLVKLRRNAAVLDELDVTASFARLAEEQNLVRPILNNGTGHLVIGGRHPTVEGGLFEQGRNFVRNDCLVGSSPTEGRLWLITGPNMAGKSTFLRQNALITIMAQIGCYVPASYAELGIVDAIFSRVGSADNLYRDQSTFMVEMIETAHILKHATPRSFVIMDEIGRGTTPEDGTAVSYACLHHLATVNQCRALFATHFHAVADQAAADGLCASGSGVVKTYCTDVEEDGRGGFVYVHRLRSGVNRQSHALKVARLAGLPERAVDMARRVLEHHPTEATRVAEKSGMCGTG